MMRWLLHGSSDLGCVRLDANTLKHANEFTAREANPDQAVISAGVQEMQTRAFWARVEQQPRANVLPMRARAK